MSDQQVSSIVLYVICLIILLYFGYRYGRIGGNIISSKFYTVAWFLVLAGIISMLIMTSVQKVVLIYYLIMSLIVSFFVIFIDAYITFNQKRGEPSMGYLGHLGFFTVSFSMIICLALNSIEFIEI